MYIYKYRLYIYTRIVCGRRKWVVVRDDNDDHDDDEGNARQNDEKGLVD